MAKRICIPKEKRDSILKAMKSGDISIEKLFEMTDTQRNSLFSKYVGKNQASLINAKFEQAMLSKQKKALSNWVKDVVLKKEPIRRDMLKKVNKIEKFLEGDAEKGFLKDLAESKLGLRVTEQEATKILELNSQIDQLRKKVLKSSDIRSKDRLAYGYALDNFKEFVGNLKLEADAMKFKEFFKNAEGMSKGLLKAAQTTKSLVATLDDSFIGRQGIKQLLSGEFKIWGNALVTSIRGFKKELFTKSPGLFKDKDDAFIKSVRADVFSRPNALNGKYTASRNGYGLGVLHEEAFPISFPEKIPVLGRVFKASETAFKASAIRMRADLADKMIAMAEKNGVDMLDEAQATAFGNIVTSLTGRGELTTFAGSSEFLNAVMFAPRFLKANFNTLTAHQLQKGITPAARKAAAMSTLRIATGIGSLLALAKSINPDSVDLDPRSSRFGKICRGNTCFDITGGMAGLATLGLRLVPTVHNGKLSLWTKSSTSGKYTNLSEAGFGQQTALDTLEFFFEGKLSPIAGAIRDLLRNQTFAGEKPTIKSTVTGLVTPISVSTLTDELKKGSDDILLVMIAETFGISVSDIAFRGFGTKFDELKEKKGDEVYFESLETITRKFNERAKKLRESEKWKKMTNEEQAKAIDEIRKEENNKIFKKFRI